MIGGAAPCYRRLRSSYHSVDGPVMRPVAAYLVEREESPWTLMTTFTKVNLAEHMTGQPATDRLSSLDALRGPRAPHEPGSPNCPTCPR